MPVLLTTFIARPPLLFNWRFGLFFPKAWSFPIFNLRFDEFLEPSEAEPFSWIGGYCYFMLIKPIFSLALIF